MACEQIEDKRGHPGMHRWPRPEIGEATQGACRRSEAHRGCPGKKVERQQERAPLLRLLSRRNGRRAILCQRCGDVGAQDQVGDDGGGDPGVCGVA